MMHNIASLHAEGKSLREIERLTGIPRKRVSYELKQAGVEIKPRSKGTTGIRNYPMWEEAFEMIDTEEKAYWLGFLMADGDVNDRTYSIELSLQIRDIGHIEKMKAFLRTGVPVKERLIAGKHKAGRIQVCSKKLVQDLMRYGCVPRKSLKLEFPELPAELIPHFMRGYMDGDGTLYKRPDGQVEFSVLGTEAFLQRYQQELMKLGLNETQITCTGQEGKAFQLRYNGNRNVAVIVDYLYRDATIWLERKRDKIAHVKPCEPVNAGCRE